MDYQLLAIFVAVAEQNSFSRAARMLGIGKGTVSRAIARLEALAGAELIHRTTHDVSLSTAGTALYERTAPHLAALNSAVVRLPEHRVEPSGELRLTAPLDFSAVVLPELIAQFSRRYPDVRFDLRITNTKVDIVREGYDLSVRATTGKLKDSALTMRRLAPVAMAWYASPSYVARRGRPKQVGADHHDWIISPHFVAMWKVPRGAVRFQCDDINTARLLARAGAGVTPLPTFLAAEDVRDGALEIVSAAGLPNETGGSFVFLYPSSGEVPRKVSAFIDFAVERLKRSPLV
ncbi:Transcriptional regulator, LysR family protein [Minicystis rosea]|nr:Transcriptional regulator, LysR family protein [Minicystis rosea]